MKKLLLWTIIMVIIGGGIYYPRTSLAVSATLGYNGVAFCYPVGSIIPGFSLDAQVDETGIYEVLHTVTSENGSPAPPTTVYSGTLEAGVPQSFPIAGGVATVPGTYTLVGTLSHVVGSTSTVVAETSTLVYIETPCREPPTPTPMPTSIPEAMPEVLPADVLWSQMAQPRRGVEVGAILVITVKALNIGAGGSSEAILTYDPTVLQVLDAIPARESDWIKERRDVDGTLRIALGHLAPQTATTMQLRFYVLGATDQTVIRMVREDGKDYANPLFLTVGRTIDEPVSLGSRSIDNESMVIEGHGYKPGEKLSMWYNMHDGSTYPIAQSFWASYDADGSIQIHLTSISLADKAESIVVYGQISEVTGIVKLEATNASFSQFEAALIQNISFTKWLTLAE